MDSKLRSFIMVIVAGALLGFGVYSCIISASWITFVCAGVLATLLGVNMIDYFWEDDWINYQGDLDD